MSVAISLVIVWAIVMIFVLPLMPRALGLSTGVAGAWIGTSEFADAAGLAAAQTYGGYAGTCRDFRPRRCGGQRVHLMKVIGRDVWIGVWAFVLSLMATTRWERTGIETGQTPEKSGGASRSSCSVFCSLARSHSGIEGVQLCGI